MPTFCRHNRFVERCPICSKTLVPEKPLKPVASKRSGVRRSPKSGRSRQARQGERLRVHREVRAEDDGYRSALLAGLRSSHDATRLVDEIAFASGRLVALREAPPGLYAQVRAQPDLEQASWMCFLITYLSPLQGDDPFVGIRAALEQAGDWYAERAPDFDQVKVGPRTAHDPARGSETLAAYRRWAKQSSSQAQGFSGESSWSPQRRFERVFERLAFPGFGRFGRFDLLLSMGALGLYELQADSLHLVNATGRTSEDPTTMAAKRVFGIGDALNLGRRSAVLAEALEVPVGALDLALYNWAASERVTLGFPSDICDLDALERARKTLEL
jgi:hypothetical protein